jgi:hypothetical protein
MHDPIPLIHADVFQTSWTVAISCGATRYDWAGTVVVGNPLPTPGPSTALRLREPVPENGLAALAVSFIPTWAQ